MSLFGSLAVFNVEQLP